MTDSRTTNWDDVEKPENFQDLLGQEILQLSLRAIRDLVGVNQERVAQVMSLTQSDVSKIERRNDHLISTVRSYIEALGGKLEITVLINGKRITLVDF